MAESGLPTVAPIPMGEKAFLEKDYLQEQRAWAQRCMIEPAKGRWLGKPWADEALAVTQAAFDNQRQMAPDSWDLGFLADRLRALLKVCGEDSLLEVLASRAFNDEHNNWRESQPFTLRLLARQGMPAALEMMLIQQRYNELATEGASYGSLRARMIGAMVRALSDDSYDSLSDAVLVRHLDRYYNTPGGMMTAESTGANNGGLEQTGG